MQPTSQRIRVHLVDDHTILRAALRSLLERRPDVEVVGDDGDPRAAVDAIAATQPDVVLLDITMPGLSGIDLIAKLHAVSPRTRVLMLSHHESASLVTQAMRAGAVGYLSKDSDDAELGLALAAVMRGDPYLSPRIAGNLVERLVDSEVTPVAEGPIDRLTPREREVFQLLALGRCNKEVARELGMSLGTAKKHRESLQRKLDCHSTAELARLAIREGLLST